MSWYYYFLVGSESQARKFYELAGSDEQFLARIFRIETKLWNTAMLATLRQTVNGEPINCDRSQQVQLLCGTENDSPWLWPVHDDIVNYLQALNHAELTKFTDLWLKKDKFIPRLCTKKVLTSMLLELQHASILSKHTDSSVFLYQA